MSTSQSHNPTLVAEIAAHYKEILRLIGEDPEREGLIKTPERAAKALLDATSGYKADVNAMSQKAIFEHDGTGMVMVKGIEIYSLCEHHILPFFGTVTIAYIPTGKIIGLSKLGRIADAFARRLQVQERLTKQLCEFLSDAIPNKGVIVCCRARHMCIQMRGVEKQMSETRTIEYSGQFAESPELRAEFMQLASDKA